MKKFFSLVLALVMALSLTTVAWGAGATYYVSATGDDLAAGTDVAPLKTIATALGKSDVEKIVLLSDITLANFITIDKDVTIDLNNNEIIGGNKHVFKIANDVDVIFKNGTITNAAADGRCIFTNGSNINLTIDNMTLKTTGSGKTQPLTVGGNADVNGNGTFDAAELVTISITGSTITAAGTGYAITTFNPVEMTITNSTVSGYAALNIKVASGSLGSAGSTFDVVNSDLIGTNSASPDPSNAFSTVMVEDSDVTINIDADSSVTAAETNSNSQCIFGFGNEYVTAEITGSAVNVADGAELNGTILGINDQQQSIAGKTVTVPAEYADELAAEGYVVTVDSTGAVVPTGVSASAPIGGTALPTLYDMVTTDAAKTKTVMVTVTTYAAKAPKDLDKPADGIQADEVGNVAYMMFSNLPGQYFVQVNSVSKADYTVYYTGTESVFGYFAKVASPSYWGNGVAFYNFGEACGQYDDTPVIGAQYYTFQGNLYMADPTYASTTNLMVGTTLTPVTLVAAADDANWVTHVAKFTYDKNYVITAVECAECGTPAVIYPNYASVPKAEIKAENVYGPINTDDYYCWLAGPVADTETDKDDKVTSADTFDAGIAMYVGMSVMAATGAVVLKKRED